jgi:hypothetical protein
MELNIFILKEKYMFRYTMCFVLRYVKNFRFLYNKIYFMINY